MFRGATLFALVLAGLLVACGGGSGGGGSTPPPSGGGGTTTQNPCATALTTEAAPELTGLTLSQPNVTTKHVVDGDPRGRALEALWLHQAAQQRGIGPRPRDLLVGPAPVAADQGEIAIVQDQGDVILPPNSFDLQSIGLRFTRNGSGGYSVARIDASFRSALGPRVTLGDDDSAQINIPFSFPFYGSAQTAAFVNSDGNITFGQEDKASTERNVARLLTGPARVAPFLADLDQTTGGKTFVNAAADQYTVTWCGVRGFDSTNTVTVQSTLLPDGSIEFKYGSSITLGDAVVGLSPGFTGQFAPVDLSKAPVSGDGAVGERFAADAQLDTVTLAQKFYSSHPDNYDQILIWSDQKVIPASDGAFSYELTVANEIRGLGQDIYDLSRDYGSAGRLRSLVVMDYLGKFPDDPRQKFLGENNTLSVMGQEVGHRWLAYLEFKGLDGRPSDSLLGRDLAHWSFFFNSEASVMEGNQIDDLGGGQFKTTAAVQRFSKLDQYAMGLLPPSQVPSFFYVDSPVSTSKLPGDPPQVGVTFTGTRRDLLIDDVIAVEGARSPAADGSPKTHRQAFVYLVGNGRSPDAGQIAKLDNIRKQWEGFLSQATDGRMTAVTTIK